jgi:hypothetical protein
MLAYADQGGGRRRGGLLEKVPHIYNYMCLKAS